jgi:hypothetical protein
VTVGKQTWTLSTFVDSEGSGVRIIGSPDPNQGELRLPISDKLEVFRFGNPLETKDWAMLGLVTADANQITVTLNDGTSLQAKLYELGPSVSTTMKAFAAEWTGDPSAVQITALDSSGHVIASEDRPAVNPNPSD